MPKLRSTRSLAVPLAFLLLAASVASASPTKFEERCIWEEAEKWITQNLEHIPTPYVGLIELPVIVRASIFRGLPAAEQSELWQVHFRLFESAMAPLTETQASVISRARALATPAFFEAAKTPLTPNSVRQLEALRIAAEEAFGQSGARSLLAVLGPEDPIGHDLVTAAASSGSNVALAALGAPPQCLCSVESDYCDWWCEGGGCSNGGATGGCGTMLLYDCDGVCYIPY